MVLGNPRAVFYALEGLPGDQTVLMGYGLCHRTSRSLLDFAGSHERSPFEPFEQGADTAGGQADAGIGGAVIHAQRIAVRGDRGAAREDDVAPTAALLVGLLGGEDPLVAALQAALRRVEIEQCQSQPVNGAGRRLAHAVIDHEPALGRFDRRRREAYFIGVPPRAAPRFQYQLVIAPVDEVKRVGYPHVGARSADRAVDQNPVAVDATGKQRRVFIFRRHDYAAALEVVGLFRESQRHAGAVARVGGIDDGVLVDFGQIGDARVFDAPDLFRETYPVGRQLR